MAQATNLTVKKADGTTDVTYTLQIASGGDKAPAVWQDLSASPAPNGRPTLKVEGAWNGSKTARRMTSRYEYPYAVTNPDGSVTIVNRCLGDRTFILPQDVPTSVAAEAVVQEANLLATALLTESFWTGYAPV